MRTTGLIVLSCGAAACAQPANDNCADAIPLTGYQTVSFDNSLATTDGIDNAACNFFGTLSIVNDVWYCWTATVTDVAQLTLCNQYPNDSKIAVYDGCSCPEGSGILACNDDSCGVQSQVTWNAVAGHSYLLRIGNFPGALGAAGAFILQSGLP